ncbi:hydroxymethylglutaryl-CoA reductase [Legionella gresilensis]|uniref:hydroxymethylglutaryl-CoA reductase n=1 Tax=Legionella gresilensis TaxID=91823 RepID=UPI0010413574|nr:hydroxymethylglutaryl-CoA reductase [Legionella gresilensis]
MPTNQQHARAFLEKFILNQEEQSLKERLNSKQVNQTRPAVGNDPAAYAARWENINLPAETKSLLMSNNVEYDLATYTKNIENFLGFVKVPIGLAGPIRINGLFANGDYLIPLATTEAALVASYNRGTKIISDAGGCTAILINALVNRCPVFAFENLTQVGQFLIWMNENYSNIKAKAELTTRFGKLVDLRYTIEGNQVFMSFDYETGDASGQNMVTIATQAAFDYIRENSPVQPQYAFIESNMSGDKKASVQAFQNVRGRKVVVEVTIPESLLQKQLHITVDEMVRFFATTSTGAKLSGTIGAQGHYANALAALYIACGQDAACVSESSIGLTRFEKTKNGDLYASVTLPNIMVGTVGGGTQLPTQKACLDMMGLSGAGNANAFAEVAAALCLAGELSISAAMATDTFTKAHHNLARIGKIERKENEYEQSEAKI